MTLTGVQTPIPFDIIIIIVLSGRPLRLRVLVPATNYVCKILLTS